MASECVWKQHCIFDCVKFPDLLSNVHLVGALLSPLIDPGHIKQGAPDRQVYCCRPKTF